MSWSFHKKWKIVSIVFAVSILSAVTIAHAGSLTPSSAPAVGTYTLSDIFDRLITNTSAVSGAHDFSPTTTPQSTFPTLTELYNAIPTIDASKLLFGTTYLGITGSYNTVNLLNSNVKSGITFGTSSTGTLLQALGTAGTGDVLAGKTFSSSTASNISGAIPVKTADNAVVTSATSTNKLVLTPPTGYYDGVATVSTTSTAFTAANIRTGINIFGIQGTMSTGYTYGDNSAEKVLTTATGVGTYNATNLIPSNVKIGITFATSSTGTYTAAATSGYPGSGWTASSSGSGTTPLTKANCDAAGTTNWAWFADANGDGVTTDAVDGVCVQTLIGTSLPSASFNGAVLLAPTTAQLNLASSTATTGGYNYIASSTANWTPDAYKNQIAKITIGPGTSCWGIVKTNTAGTTTVYGYWMKPDYTQCATNPDSIASTSGFKVYDDNKYDNSWIGDYTCTGNFPSGIVAHGSYPISGDTGALAVTDCYDGKRDLLPLETDRAVISGTVTATSSGVGTSTITDSALTAGLVDVNVYMGQKVLITAGTSTGSYGIIETNSTNSFTVSTWSSGAPDVGSSYKIIYIIPRASYISCTTCGANTGPLYEGAATDDLKQNNGPLTTELLRNWKGTRLPTSMDFFGYCGYKDGGSNYETTSNALSASKTYGNYGGQVGRTDQFLDLANSSYEWLSEQYSGYNARIAGSGACSYVVLSNVSTGSYRFRTVFRP